MDVGRWLVRVHVPLSSPVLPGDALEDRGRQRVGPRPVVEPVEADGGVQVAVGVGGRVGAHRDPVPVEGVAVLKVAVEPA